MSKLSNVQYYAASLHLELVRVMFTSNILTNYGLFTSGTELDILYMGRKIRNCSHMRFPSCLAWAITIHKSQGLTLPQTVLDIGNKEFVIGLTFATVSGVRALSELLFNSTFSYNRLQKLETSTRL
ncbi:1091_t:CDS:2 [Ambispora leptoticha]|uniref:1091_t:CDS:1 n=1 Tax=Ambispora leptoticha TaxID=144679 RepID=A0A9N9I1Y2_9GLOM|nr:1091_t:CDS:2 [Ambispora leptoticha]